MKIIYADMVKTLAKGGDLILAELTPIDAHQLHMAVGISGEAGELALAVADYHFRGKQLDNVNVVEELGDIEFYHEGLCQSMDVDGNDIVDMHETSWIIPDSLLEASFYVCIKASEVLDLVKKAVIYRKLIDIDLVSKELGEMQFYMEHIRNRIQTTREDTLEANVAKLSVRYEGLKYSDESAQNRADKKQGE